MRSVSSEIALRQALHRARARETGDGRARPYPGTLLPPRLPKAPGMDVAATHLPADATGVAGVEVVGDFYDLFHTRGLLADTEPHQHLQSLRPPLDRRPARRHDPRPRRRLGPRLRALLP